MNDFDATAYWSGREFKKWVVQLESGPRRRPDRDTKYIRARTSDGAIRTARRETSLKRPRVTLVSLATPRDLGCEACPA